MGCIVFLYQVVILIGHLVFGHLVFGLLCYSVVDLQVFLPLSNPSGKRGRVEFVCEVS